MRVKSIKLYQTRIDLENGNLHPRGVIKDYFGEEIASNEKVFQLHLIPENAENLSALIFRLKNILKMSDNAVSRIKKLNHRNLGTQSLYQII